MRLDLYILGNKMDLFSDENVTLNSSIQNILDISKVFSDYTKDFNIPASRGNNLVMKHFYRSDIISIDLRVSHSAELRLNDLPYKQGRVNIVSAKLSKGVAESYQVVFYSWDRPLKEILGEDKLNKLDLTFYDHEFSEANVKKGLTSYIDTNKNGQTLPFGDVVYSLISRDNRYIMDSAGGTYPDAQNIYYSSSSQTSYVNFLDLKPSIKVLRIIEAIETKYGINFSNHFFDSSNLIFNNFYMWLNATSGPVGIDDKDNTEKTVRIAGFVKQAGQDFTFENNASELVFDTWFDSGIGYLSMSGELLLTPSDSKKYNVKVTDIDNDLVLYEQNEISGNHTATIDMSADGYPETWRRVVVDITTTDNLSGIYAEWKLTHTLETRDEYWQDYGEYETPTLSVIDVAVIAKNIPEMKVIDFLTSLFKMYNLTAYQLDDGTINVMPLDTYYANGNSYDITEFVDIDSTLVAQANVYKNIGFKFEDPKTFLAKYYKDNNQRVFGDLNYNTDFEGGDYNIEVQFCKLLEEQIYDVADGNETERGYAWAVDENQKSVAGKPVLIFNMPDDPSAPYGIAYKNGTAVDMLTTYNRPTNFITTNDTLTFGEEVDPYNETICNPDKTLFAMYYKNYIQSMMDIKQRLTTLTAYLPITLILKITTADTLIIGGVEYRINTMKTDLLTYKTEFTLLLKL